MKHLLHTLCMAGALLLAGAPAHAQVIFQETFNNIPGPTAGGAGTYTFPLGWSLRNVDNRTPDAQVSYVNEAWERREDFKTNVADSCAFSNSYYRPGGKADDWMWTPPIALPAAASHLKWRAQSYDPLYPDGYEVRIMVVPNLPGGGTGVLGNQVIASTLLATIPAENASWTTRAVSLENWAGHTVRIAFRNNSSDKFILVVDDITVEVTSISGGIIQHRNVSCNGGSDGLLMVGPHSGTFPYTYSWSPSGGTAATASNLAAGTYTCTVTDANFNVRNMTATVTEPEAISASASITHVNCPGGNTGSALVLPTGGTWPYTYAWQGVSGTNPGVGWLTEGNYSCIITDNKGCTFTKPISIITEPPAVVSVTIPVDGDYETGQSLNFLVQLNTSVLVNTAGGTPAINFSLNSGSNKIATYRPGPLSDQLIFQYDIQPEDQDLDGITINNNIELQGGLITATVGGCNLSLALIGLPANNNIRVNLPKPQTIDFPSFSVVTYGDADFNSNANASSNLPISLSSDNHAVATIVNGQIHIVGAGTCVITATQQGDNFYLPAAAMQRTLTVEARHVTVTADALTKLYGDADPALTYTITPALVPGDLAFGTLSRAPGENPGNYTVTLNTLTLGYNYAVNYQDANFTIQPKPITVTANAGSKIFGQSDPTFTFTIAPALLSGDALAGTLSRTAGEDAGTYAINIGNLVNPKYAISFMQNDFTIDKATQQISWNQVLSSGCDNSSTITLTATTSSGLPVTYTSTDLNIATISNNVLSIVKPGTTTITALQAGNGNYLPASSVSNELTARLSASLLVKHWDDVLFFDNSSRQYIAWQWYKNGSLVNAANGQYYYETGKLQGVYHAIAKTATGELLETCPLNITPGPRTKTLNVSPNPARAGQMVTLKIAYTAAQLQGASITVANVQGMILQTLQKVTPQTNIQMPFVQGIYVVRLKLANGANASTNVVVR